MFFKKFAKAIRILLFGTKAERRRLRLEVARILAGSLGDFYLGDDHKIWRDDTIFIAKFKSLSPDNLYSMERKWTVREFVRWTNELHGDIAECGSYIGVTASFIASETSRDVTIFLFDSFEGLSQPHEFDENPSPDIHTWKQGDMATTEDVLRRNLTGYDNICIKKGWIPTRFSEVSSHLFKFVHIDVDLYEPTIQSLQFFYPRLVMNGVIILDDFGFKTCPGAYRAANDFACSTGESVIHLPTGQGLIIRRR